MQLILAIDSDPRRSEQLANLVRARLQVDLVQATSAGEALHALKDRVPDLILTSPLLSPFDDGVLDEYLRDLGAAAMHVQTLRIPMLSSGPKKKSAATRLFSLGRKKTQTSPAAPDGCDPKVFADEIAHYLTRSFEERSASTKVTADKSDSAKATAGTFASFDATATTGHTSRAWAPAREPDAFEQVVDDWGVPNAIVQEFNETQAGWSANAEVSPAPEPVAEDSYVPGSILDLRPAPPKPRSEGGPAAPKPRGEAGLVTPKPRSEGEPASAKLRNEGEPASPKPRGEGGQLLVAIEPEPYVLIDPDPVVEPEFITSQAIDAEFRPVARIEPAPPVVSRPVVEPTVTAPVMAAPVFTPPAAPRPPATVPPAPTPAASNSTSGNSTSGNSASFEAALAAIRAAWEKPESTTTRTTTRTTPPAAPVTLNPLDGSGEVDLTDQMDAHRDVTRLKMDRPAKRQETVNKHRTSAAEHRGGGADTRSDWDAFDPREYEVSTLVNTLDEVTDSNKVTTRATKRR
jgi:hypothetical protein